MIQNEHVRDFYAEIAVNGAASGFARTYVLEAESEALGYVFGLYWRGRYHYLLIGCDYERHGRHSPGLILYDTIMEDIISEGGRVFDFTIGDEHFKMDFGTRPTPIFALHDEPTWRGKLMRLGLEARRQFASLGQRQAPGG
jgi:CelD/BcsL family acetyltransferase involved in cellulose biosynthesis